MKPGKLAWVAAMGVAFALLSGCGGSTNSTGGTVNPPFTYLVTLSAATLSFPSTSIGATATMPVSVTNAGTAPILFSSIAIANTTGAAFTQSNTCGTTLMVASSCVATITFAPTALGPASATLTFTDNASPTTQSVTIGGTGATAALTYSVAVTPAALTFPATSVGTTASAQTINITNTGTGVLSLTSVAVSGSNSSFFTQSATTCGATLNPGSSCSTSIVFTPSASGADSAAFTVADNAASSPQTVSFTGTAIGTATTANTVDCSLASLLCADTFTGAFTNAGGVLASDPIAAGGFHGYADVSVRKDPNSSISYLAYSWPHTSADGTHVVDIHLASSANSGMSYTEIGSLYQSTIVNQGSSSAYSTVNDSSTETIDLLPIPLSGTSAGQTLWIQAHQAYLDKPLSAATLQQDATAVISLSAVALAAPASAVAGNALLALSTAPEARLGGSATDPTRLPTQNLAALSSASAKCSHWGQPALWYQAPLLYLALECSETSGGGNIDANELAHFMYSTTPTGTDASQWTWNYVGEFGTAAEVAKLGALPSENVAYQFFTEPEFALSKSGRLIVIMSPSIFSPAGSTQPVIQYGCRAFPVTITPNSVALTNDLTTGAPAIVAKVGESDLYGNPNEGPGACTYEPATAGGILLERKYENDPTYGFFIYPVNSGILP